MDLILQDWVATMFTIFMVLAIVGIWIWGLTRPATPEKPSTYVPHLFMLILLTGIGVGLIILTWGGRAYYLGHRTEADNQAAYERDKEIRKTPDLDVDLVEKIRRDREEKEKQRKLEEERRKNREAREKSDEYLKALEGKDKK